jgi:tetratricopeptide (TPR) repeat protein
MKTKRDYNCWPTGIVLLVLLCFVPAIYAREIPIALQEIEELYSQGKYSQVLEKSLNILNIKEDRLTPPEGALVYYYTGLAYKKNQNDEMAADYLKKLAAKYPGSDYLKSAYLELADLYKEDYSQREAYLEKLFTAFPRTPEAVQAGIQLSKEYLRLKNFQKALPIMETLVNLWKKGEENPELYLLMAVAYSGIKDYLEAGEYWRRAEKPLKATIESNPLFLFEGGKILHNNLEFREAITYLEQLFNVFPTYKDLTEASILLAQCYEREHNPFLGAVFLIKTIEKNPPQKYIHSLFLNLGRILGKLDEKELKRLQQSYPLYVDARKLLTYVASNALDFEQRKAAVILLSEEYKKNNNWEGIVDQYYKFLGDKRDPLVEKLFKQDLDNYLYDLEKKENYQQIFKVWVKLKRRKSYLSPENLLKFGEALFRMKMAANAEEIYNHLLTYRMYSKYWPIAREQLARIDLQLGRYEECLNQIDRVDIDREEKSEFVYYRLFCCLNLGRDNEVKRLLDGEAASFNKITTVFQYRIAQLKAEQLEKEKKYTQALEIYREMMTFKPVPARDEARLMVSIANLYYEIKDLEAALSYYRQAEKYNTDREWTLYRVTTICNELDKAVDAGLELEKLKKINPNSFWVKQLEKNAR